MTRRRGYGVEPQSVAEAYADLRADFRMARDSRFHSSLPGGFVNGVGADYHYRSERHWLHMIERARHYQRNDQVVGAGVRRLSANIIQEGFTPDPMTGDPEIDQELSLRWDEWSKDPDLCHSEGEHDFHQLESMVLSSVIVDGDILPLPLRSGSLQMVEAHRCRTPTNTTQNVVHGIKLRQPDAVRLEYWITNEDLDPHSTLTRVSDIRKIPARDSRGNRQVFHVYFPNRTSQRRGVTQLAPVSDTVGMSDDLQFAKLVQVQSAAMIAFIHNYEDIPASSPPGQKKGDQEEHRTAGGGTQLVENIGPAMEVHGDPGETITGFAPNIPGQDYVPYSRLLLTFISINLDLPLVTLLLDASMTNFSGWRGAIDQARLRFREISSLMVSKFHRPVYRWKVRQWAENDPALNRAMDRGGIRLGNHRWKLPSLPYIEPLKDASADLLQQRNALNSPRRIQAARGRDLTEVQQELIADNSALIRMAAAAAAELREEFEGLDVTWREVISLPTPDRVSTQLAVGQDSGSQQEEGAAA